MSWNEHHMRKSLGMLHNIVLPGIKYRTFYTYSSQIVIISFKMTYVTKHKIFRFYIFSKLKVTKIELILFFLKFYNIKMNSKLGAQLHSVGYNCWRVLE